MVANSVARARMSSPEWTPRRWAFTGPSAGLSFLPVRILLSLARPLHLGHAVPLFRLPQLEAVALAASRENVVSVTYP